MEPSGPRMTPFGYRDCPQVADLSSMTPQTMVMLIMISGVWASCVGWSARHEKIIRSVSPGWSGDAGRWEAPV